jgi:hypothetical protein
VLVTAVREITEIGPIVCLGPKVTRRLGLAGTMFLLVLIIVYCSGRRSVVSMKVRMKVFAVVEEHTHFSAALIRPKVPAKVIPVLMRPILCMIIAIRSTAMICLSYKASLERIEEELLMND